jgi:hypothetical protein
VSNRRRSRTAARPAPRRRARPARDFWGPEPPEDVTPAPVRPTDHPTALIHSLGTPPLPNSAVAKHYFDAVYERAAALAIALATSAGLTETDEPD